MFRFLGIAWNDASEAANAAAARLCATVKDRADWTRVAGTPGLDVFMTGARGGANRHYDLGPRGVILGKLFLRVRLDTFTVPVHVDSIDDPERLQESGGRALVGGYWGRYVAFVRSPTGITSIVRDPSGTLPCHLMQHDGVYIAFSWLEDVIDLMPSIPRPAIRWSALAAQVRLGEPSGRETALEGVTQVVAGEAVYLVHPRPERALVWNATDHARVVATEDLAEAATLLRRTMLHCAASWASCYPRVLLRLSGGVDSSMLLACLAHEEIEADVTCLNYHSPGANSDERAYARLAAARFDRKLVELERPSATLLDGVLRIARTPSPTSYVGRIGTARSDAEVARAHGAPAMFTGGGGDQLFFELHHWWPAADYLRLRGLDGGFLGAALDAARLGGLSLWKTLRLALADRFRSGPLPHDSPGAGSLIDPEALAADALAPFEHPAMRHVDGLPIGKLMQLQILLAHGGYYDPFEGARAPELVNPFLSQPLIELCLALPTYVLAHGGHGRALARQAFASDLPPEIAARRSKGGMSEMVKALLLDNLAFARSLLLDGELVRRGILRRDKVEEALSGRPSTLSGNVVEIHDLISTEAWIRRWTE
ncbi:asparagine synthase-related protein [Aquabacterium humicola]|uniref:asparagine synthase-related protein n=1 Tax=Aquabacterium humicola TaxID=3237377 RepID=UPI002543A3D9|nr:asparagine synthase C-terminal domain-containing protein [Rubrivivax pictus]